MKDMQNGTLDIFTVAPGVWGMHDMFVNFYMIRNSSDDDWVLVDAGLKFSAGKIKAMAARLFGSHSKPQAIILTHGHFDHVGSVAKLADEWNVSVYAHTMEKPYLTGQSSYPPPDPSVGGGLMSMLSFLYPKSPIDIKERLKILPANGSIPGLEDWKYIHTPGHAPGHISLYREKDKVLIAGDAFVTTKAESAYSVLRQTKKISGPPKYFTYDWAAAQISLNKLAELEPEIVATGHGQPMRGTEMRNSLNKLSWKFEEKAVPKHGRYVGEPAIVDEEGVKFIPDRPKNIPSIITIAAISATVTFALVLLIKKKKKARAHKTLYKSELEFE